MLDPFPLAPPRFLVSAVQPFADTLGLHSLPLHVHEVLFATALYTFTQQIFSPWISGLLCPKTYPRLSRRNKLNWDVHVVSFVQSCLINALSLYIIWFDEERKAWRSPEAWEQRIWGYYGIGGLAQSFALGYFLWDLYTCSVHVDIFGWGMLAHAVSASVVFALGYRPFIYFYAPVFLLYELSSPFLNIHWFCDKLDLTGSMLQAVNGVCLVVTFFSCRIVWGLYSSYWVFSDAFHPIKSGQTNFAKTVPLGKVYTHSTRELLAFSRAPEAQQAAFNREQFLPIWLPAIYLASNLILNALNIFWFGKMIETIRTRFDPPFGTKAVEANETSAGSKVKDGKSSQPRRQSQLNPEGGTVEEEVEPQSKPVLAKPATGQAAPSPKKAGSVRAARARAEQAMNGPVGTVEDTKMEIPRLADPDLDVDVTGSARQTARSRRKA